MQNYALLSDMTCDLSAEVLDRLGVCSIPMSFRLGEMDYMHYADERELPLTEFYDRLKAGEDAVTTQINPAVYLEYFEKELKAGRDIVYICFTSGLSGTYNTANLIMKELLEEYPERRIHIIDSLCASIGEGLLVFLAGTRYQAGASFEELSEYIEQVKTKCCHWFTVDDLYHLKRGGRLSSLEALVGTALKIKPVLSVDKEGKLCVISKERGTRKALGYLANRLIEDGEDVSNQTIIIGHANALEYAEALAEIVRSQVEVKDILITNIGPIIGTHVGAGMCGMVFVGENYKF